MEKRGLEWARVYIDRRRAEACCWWWWSGRERAGALNHTGRGLRSLLSLLELTSRRDWPGISEERAWGRNMDNGWMGLVPGAVSGRGRLGSDSPPASSSPIPCVHACAGRTRRNARARAPRPLSHFLIRCSRRRDASGCSRVLFARAPGPAGFLAWKRRVL
jgi:hypothetical protein